MEELEKKPGFNGRKVSLDLHRPFVDDFTYTCSKCGATMHRTPEVIDCWFDSGAMPFAQFGYMGQKGTPFDERFPSDYISEAIDQTRGWFYSLHAISTLLFNRPSYLNVICLGHILDAKGEKMSKSKGNAVYPRGLIDKYGADALRWHLYTASPPGNARRFEEKQVLEVTRRFLMTLWNVYSFFVMYANIDQYKPGMNTNGSLISELDRWILSELNQLIKDVDSGLDKYDPTDAGRKIEAFIDRLSNWYVRRSRRRFWKSGSDADKLAAYNTLYECLVTLSKLLAPFTPFVADELYRNLVITAFPEQPESVHLADFPSADTSKINIPLSDDIRLAMEISSIGRSARSKAGIKVRQPLSHAIVSVSGSSDEASMERIKPQIIEELNVKSIILKRFSEMQGLDDQGYAIAGIEQRRVEHDFHEQGISSLSGIHLVAVPLTISPELIAEGIAREIVHRVQTMRRSAGFEIADHITLFYEGDMNIGQIMIDPQLGDYIKQEILADTLVDKVPGEGAYTETFKLEGHEVKLGVRKVD
jgi:isoleucyl-tRNA synthetase